MPVYEEFYRLMKIHHWYVELVATSKLLEALNGAMPTNEEISRNGVIEIKPNGWHTLKYRRIPLIKWKFKNPKFDPLNYPDHLTWSVRYIR